MTEFQMLQRLLIIEANCLMVRAYLLTSDKHIALHHLKTVKDEMQLIFDSAVTPDQTKLCLGK